MTCTAFLIGLVTLFALGYLYVNKKYRYWKEKGIPHMKPTFPMGSVWGIFTSKGACEVVQRAYRELKGKDVVGGQYLFTTPTLITLDLDFMKTILVKDFQYFHDRGLYVNERDDPLTVTLFNLSGQKWKVLRTKLSPTFTSGKMKLMHSTIVGVAKEFQACLAPYANRGEEIEFKDILARFTTDVIGSSAFGVNCNSLKDPNTEFRRVGRQIFNFDTLGFFRALLITLFPSVARSLRMKVHNDQIRNFFMKLVKDTIEYRERNHVQRNDFLNLLIQLKNTGKLEGDNIDLGKLTFEELVAQCFVFFLAGFDTSSSTMTFALYEMALNQDIQDRVRKEVQEVLERHGGEYTYEACMEMKYLDRVIQETLRKYPVVDSVIRVATNDYKIPQNGKVIDKGTLVIFPIYSMHRDPEIYPNPELFNPDRFTEENIKARHPFAWLPFGEGPRVCIGMRFGMMQVRVGLASLINKYRIGVTQKTPIPMVLSPISPFLSPKGGMWLKIENV